MIIKPKKKNRLNVRMEGEWKNLKERKNTQKRGGTYRALGSEIDESRDLRECADEKTENERKR